VLEIPAEVDANGDPVADPGAASHHLAVREMAAWPLPGTGPGALRLFLSRNARHALVSWEDGDRIYYRETGEAGWSDVYMLHLGPSLDRDKAYALLDERVRNH
jgi:hypothetical protein